MSTTKFKINKKGDTIIKSLGCQHTSKKRVITDEYFRNELKMNIPVDFNFKVQINKLNNICEITPREIGGYSFFDEYKGRSADDVPELFVVMLKMHLNIR